MAKEIEGYLKLQVPAGQANPSPPIGPALGQRGLNIMEFSKAFNDATKDEIPGTPLPTTITIYVDKSFTFKVKTAPTSYLLKRRLKLIKDHKHLEENPKVLYPLHNAKKLQK